MRVFLAAAINQYRNIREFSDIDFRSVYLLESYYYLLSNKKAPESIWTANDNFLLDSGAFTFMQSAAKSGEVDWISYADKYADFIRNHKIKYYFELDIDSLKGLRYVEMLRSRIENRVGWQCIPVWHTERGKDYFLGMVRDYNYVSLGSIAKVMPPQVAIAPEYLPWFVSTAHKNGAKIHALGYTSSRLKDFHFDSVDSSSWLMGNISGGYCKFDLTKGLVKSHPRPIDTKIRNYKEVMAHNFLEWVKFQKYADINL